MKEKMEIKIEREKTRTDLAINCSSPMIGKTPEMEIDDSRSVDDQWRPKLAITRFVSRRSVRKGRPVEVYQS